MKKFLPLLFLLALPFTSWANIWRANVGTLGGGNNVNGSNGVPDYAALNHLTNDTYALTATPQIMNHFYAQTTNGVVTTASNITVRTTGIYLVGFTFSGVSVATNTIMIGVYTNAFQSPIDAQGSSTNGLYSNIAANNIMVLQAGMVVDARISGLVGNFTITNSDFWILQQIQGAGPTGPTGPAGGGLGVTNIDGTLIEGTNIVSGTSTQTLLSVSIPGIAGKGVLTNGEASVTFSNLTIKDTLTISGNSVTFLPWTTNGADVDIAPIVQGVDPSGNHFFNFSPATVNDVLYYFWGYFPSSTLSGGNLLALGTNGVFQVGNGNAPYANGYMFYTDVIRGVGNGMGVEGQSNSPQSGLTVFADDINSIPQPMANFNFDGSGQVASNNISWTKGGFFNSLKIGGAVVVSNLFTTVGGWRAIPITFTNAVNDFFNGGTGQTNVLAYCNTSVAPNGMSNILSSGQTGQSGIEIIEYFANTGTNNLTLDARSGQTFDGLSRWITIPPSNQWVGVKNGTSGWRSLMTFFPKLTLGTGGLTFSDNTVQTTAGLTSIPSIPAVGLATNCINAISNIAYTATGATINGASSGSITPGGSLTLAVTAASGINSTNVSIQSGPTLSQTIASSSYILVTNLTVSLNVTKAGSVGVAVSVPIQFSGAVASSAVVSFRVSDSTGFNTDFPFSQVIAEYGNGQSAQMYCVVPSVPVGLDVVTLSWKILVGGGNVTCGFYNPGGGTFAPGLFMGATQLQ